MKIKRSMKTAKEKKQLMNWRKEKKKKNDRK